MIEVKHTIMGWIIGLGGVSLILGAVVSFMIWKKLHNYFDHLNKSKGWNLSDDFTKTVTLYPVLVGIIDRIFFTFIVAFQVTGVGGGIVAWIGIKMAAGWGLSKRGKRRTVRWRLQV